MRDRNPDHRPVEPSGGIAPWVGGKRNLAGRLIERIERIPHRCYAEPFIGMGGVFLRRRRRAPVEALNDRAGDVVNLFRCLQRHPSALLGELRFSVSSRAEFERWRRVDPAALTDIERAARFVYLQYNAYGGRPSRPAFGTSAIGRTRLRIGRVRALLAAIHRRLQGVVVENLGFADFIRLYDRPTTLFYLDPPYWGCETYYGRGLFAREDFERLAGVLRTIEGRFLLSLNDTPGVRATFKGFRTERIATTYKVNGSKRVHELLISGGGQR
ncbi:MAG: DNA adenine methylase [Rhodospirillales bacterium]|nr:DNA adenine methylase [Rhodospirillales bacterium]